MSKKQQVALQLLTKQDSNRLTDYFIYRLDLVLGPLNGRDLSLAVKDGATDALQNVFEDFQEKEVSEQAELAATLAGVAARIAILEKNTLREEESK